MITFNFNNTHKDNEGKIPSLVDYLIVISSIKLCLF